MHYPSSPRRQQQESSWAIAAFGGWPCRTPELCNTSQLLISNARGLHSICPGKYKYSSVEDVQFPTLRETP